MARIGKTYKGENGKLYPLVEAAHDCHIKVRRKHCKHALQGSTSHCVIAEAIRDHDWNVIEVCITAGRDAWVIMETDEHPDGCATHFVLNKTPQVVRDKFDAEKKIKEQTVELRRPTASRTIAARDASNRRRREEIKAGSGKPVNHRTKPIKTDASVRFVSGAEGTVDLSAGRHKERSPLPRTRVSTHDHTTLIQMRPRARITRGSIEVPTGAE